jgi:hypothetical protein
MAVALLLRRSCGRVFVSLEPSSTKSFSSAHERMLEIPSLFLKQMPNVVSLPGCAVELVGMLH